MKLGKTSILAVAAISAGTCALAMAQGDYKKVLTRLEVKSVSCALQVDPEGKMVTPNRAVLENPKPFGQRMKEARESKDDSKLYTLIWNMSVSYSERKPTLDAYEACIARKASENEMDVIEDFIRNGGPAESSESSESEQDQGSSSGSGSGSGSVDSEESEDSEEPAAPDFRQILSKFEVKAVKCALEVDPNGTVVTPNEAVLRNPKPFKDRIAAKDPSMYYVLNWNMSLSYSQRKPTLDAYNACIARADSESDGDVIQQWIDTAN